LQSYDLAMMALAYYLTRERDAATTINRLVRILDRDSLQDAITEVLVDARVHPRPKADVPDQTQRFSSAHGPPFRDYSG
jgi:hypothetical protein